MRRALLLIIVGALYILHQDSWFWRTAHPLVFGFLPIGLFYHACYAVATAVVMWILVRFAWPSHLEGSGEENERRGDGWKARGGEGESGRVGETGIAPQVAQSQGRRLNSSDRPVAGSPLHPVAATGEGARL